MQDFTDDPDRLINAMDALEAGNSTSLYDAIFLAVDEKLKTETGRKIIIAITDGEDNASKLRKEEAIEVAQKNDVLIYGIGVRGDLGTNFGVLRKIRRRNRRKFLLAAGPFCGDPGGFPGDRRRTSRASTAWPTVQRTTSVTVLFGAIDIRCKQGGVRVRARKGYYAPKDSPPSH